MNIITHVKSMVAIALLLSLSGAAMAVSKDTFPIRIDKQNKAVDAAKEARQINGAESKSLKKEIDAIQSLYERYWKDKFISRKEAKTLNSKLNNSDVNLFRKKYD